MAIYQPQTGNSYSPQVAIANTRDAAPPAIPVLEAQVNRLSESANHVDQTAMRLHALADRLLGQNSATEGKPAVGVPSPPYSVGKLNDAHEWLERARSNLAHAVERLEAL